MYIPLPTNRRLAIATPPVSAMLNPRAEPEEIVARPESYLLNRIGFAPIVSRIFPEKRFVPLVVDDAEPSGSESGLSSGCKKGQSARFGLFRVVDWSAVRRS